MYFKEKNFFLQLMMSFHKDSYAVLKNTKTQRKCGKSTLIKNQYWKALLNIWLRREAFLIEHYLYCVLLLFVLRSALLIFCCSKVLPRVRQWAYVVYVRTPNFVRVRTILNMRTLTRTPIPPYDLLKFSKFFWFV